MTRSNQHTSPALSKTLELAMALIARPSITPNDAGCQNILAERLEKAGFTVKHLRFGDVDNFWAVHTGKGAQDGSGDILAFAGHTDVVPPGELENWNIPPFEPRIENGILYGRGAADMKGSLAAMTVAAEQFVKQHPNHNGQLAFLITSDEEGIAVNGTVKVVEYLESINTKIRWCVVGEPSSTAKTGDIIKNGRRGSLGLTLTIEGVQGHVAYPHLANNPIHAFAPALKALSETVWDQGNAFFPATTFQVSNIKSGTGATNVIPGSLEAICNFRFSTEVTADVLKERVTQLLDQHELSYQAVWHLSGEAFLTEPGRLSDAAIESIFECNGIKSQLSTAGGTSDGRFIAPTGAEVIELGPVNKTIHQYNEQVDASELDQLTSIYQLMMQKLLTD